MWVVLVGFFGGRVLRNSRMPDSEKDARWAAREERRRRNAPVRAIATVVLLLAGLYVVATVSGVGAILVGLLLLVIGAGVVRAVRDARRLRALERPRQPR